MCKNEGWAFLSFNKPPILSTVAENSVSLKSSLQPAGEKGLSESILVSKIALRVVKKTALD